VREGDVGHDASAVPPNTRREGQRKAQEMDDIDRL
jgi:hypothetical protein